ncbi:AraC family transcriptional regulator [Paenibacillaceae bacterium]|nr:AraC family transcriptional regulator [Paenibacillaceae bacterium]
MGTNLTIQLAIPPFPIFLGCGEDVYHPGSTHPSRQSIGMFDLLYVTEGRLFMGEEAEQWTVSAGEVLILRPDKYHYSFQPCLEKTRFYWMHFQVMGGWQEAPAEEPDFTSSSLLREHQRMTGLAFMHAAIMHIPKYSQAPSTAALMRIFPQLTALENHEETEHRIWKQHRLLMEMLNPLDAARRSEASYANTRVAEKTAVYIKQHYMEHLTNGHFQSHLHFHINYLIRCMQAVYQCTPMEYLQRYRIEQSKLLLIKTEHPIAKIAEDVGFRQPSHFTRYFKALEGVTPLRYRKQFAM